jgi:uncharacterized protein YecE (DUF72 family)
MSEESDKLEKFQFLDLHPHVSFGTASDRYAGWIGQVYSANRYVNRITRRTKKVGGKAFVEEVLPVDSVKEYFQHFRVLELDFTFYRPLLDKEGKPTQSFHLLHRYREHLKDRDRLILKVPQAICAMKLRRGKAYVENDQYLNPEVFSRQFYEPAKELLDPWLEGLIFEQEYQRKQDRLPPEKLAADFDAFFSAVPKDTIYHVELRTEAFLSEPVFSIFEKHGLGQVLSNWTWLPPLPSQFSLSDRKIFNADRTCIVRLMTPLGMRYAEAYAKAHPFNALVDGMLDEQQVEKTAELMREILNGGAQINVIVNNRHGGNAPLTAQHIAKQFLAMVPD